MNAGRHPMHPHAHRLGQTPSAQLKEFTLELAESDIYIKTSNRIEMGNGHVLYEAIITDQTGSRTIYIDREEVAELIKETFEESPAEHEG